MSSLKEICVRKLRLYQGRSVDFYADSIRLPNGHRAIREYLAHPGAVAVLPLLHRRTVVLIKQYRYPVHRVTYEIPAGKLDPGETLLRCVRRELEEESGYTAKKIKHLISYWPTPAFSNEILHIYCAEGLKAGGNHPDADEFLEIAHVPIRKALRWVLQGKIRDSKTVIALLTYSRLRQHH